MLNKVTTRKKDGDLVVEVNIIILYYYFQKITSYCPFPLQKWKTKMLVCPPMLVDPDDFWGPFREFPATRPDNLSAALFDLCNGEITKVLDQIAPA